MLMERLGYFISEAPILILMIWSSVQIVRWRRARQNRVAFNQHDRNLLFHSGSKRPNTLRFCARFLLAVVAVTMLAFVQLVVLAPLGAAIITGALVLTSAAVVYRVLLHGL